MYDSRGRLLGERSDRDPIPPAASQEWKQDAACAGAPELWMSSRHIDRTEAKRICREECPVRSECLEYALLVRPDYFVWGGFTVRELRALKDTPTGS